MGLKIVFCKIVALKAAAVISCALFLATEIYGSRTFVTIKM
jgi:hypothetical protein